MLLRPQVPRITGGEGITNDIEYQIPIEEMQLVLGGFPIFLETNG